MVDLRGPAAVAGIGPQLARRGELTLCPDAPGVRPGDRVEPCPPALGVRVAELRPDAGGADAIWMEFDEVGSERLRAVSTASAAAGHRLLLVLDGAVVSAPMVRDPLTGGKVLLQPGPWAGEPAVFVAALGGGVLDAPLELVRDEPLR